MKALCVVAKVLQPTFLRAPFDLNLCTCTLGGAYHVKSTRHENASEVWCTRGWDRLFRFCTSLACRELLLSRVEPGAMSATLIVVALYKAVLNLPGALQTEMYLFGAVYLRAEILLPGDVHRMTV